MQQHNIPLGLANFVSDMFKYFKFSFESVETFDGSQLTFKNVVLLSEPNFNLLNFMPARRGQYFVNQIQTWTGMCFSHLEFNIKALIHMYVENQDCDNYVGFFYFQKDDDQDWQDFLALYRPARSDVRLLMASPAVKTE